MTVKVDISLSLAAAPAYSIDVPITVIDCEQEIMTFTDPETCPLTGVFPTFLRAYQWDSFEFLFQPLCIVD